MDPIIDELQFTQVLMDGGSDLNLLYPDTIRKLGWTLLQFGIAALPSKEWRQALTPGAQAYYY